MMPTYRAVVLGVCVALSLCLCACGDTIIEVTDVTPSLKTRSNAVQSTLASAGGSAAAHPFATLAKQPSSPQKQTSKELEQRRDEDNDEDADNGSNITDSNDVPTNANASLSETSSDADNAAKNATSEITIAAAGETDYEDEGDTSDDTDDDTQNATHVETGSDTDIEPPVQTEIQTDGETDVDTADGPHDTADDTLDDTDVDTNSSNVTAATNTTRTTNLTVVAISLGLPVTASAFTQPKQADFAALMSTLTGGDASIVGITEHAARRLLAANIVVDVEVTLASNQDADTVVSTLTQDTINDALSNSTLNISDATIISAPLISRRPPVDTDSDSDDDTGAGATDDDTTDDDAEGAMPGATDDETEIETADGPHDTADDTAETQDDMDDDVSGTTPVESDAETEIEVVETEIETEIETDGETEVQIADSPQDTAADVSDDTKKESTSNVTVATFEATDNSNTTIRVEAVVDGDETTVVLSVQFPVTEAEFSDEVREDFKVAIAALTGADPANVVILNVVTIQRRAQGNINVDFKIIVPSNSAATEVASTLSEGNINTALRASSSPVLSKMESVSVVQAPTVVVSRTPSVVSAPAVPPSPQGTPASEEEEPPTSKHVSDEGDQADSADTSGVMAGAAGGAVVVLCIAGYLLHRRRSNHTHTLDSKQAPLGPGDTEAGTLLSAVPLAQPLVQVKVDHAPVKDQGFCYPVTAPTLPGPDARYRYEPQPVLHGGWGQGWNGGFAQ